MSFWFVISVLSIHRTLAHQHIHKAYLRATQDRHHLPEASPAKPGLEADRGQGH